jgi:hypothetical protein
MQGVVLANKEYSKYNLKKGIKVLTESAKTDPFAMYLLGGIYEAGKGVDKNMDTAVKYLKDGASKGSADAMCYLGDMYYEGRGVTQSYDEAVKYYQLAKGQLTQSAAKHLAACFENGYGGLSADKAASDKLLNGDYKNTLSEVLSLVPDKE